MIELNPSRKNRINIEDYNYDQDVQTRLILATFSPLDFDVLEEILFNTLTIDIASLSRELETPLDPLFSSLSKIASSGLITYDKESIFVVKELRKYFETEMQRYVSAFTPCMRYIKKLLHKAPIHVLPVWYQLPRLSNDIFSALNEKYFKTPTLYLRYLKDLDLGNENLQLIATSLLESPTYSLTFSELKDKHGLTDKEIEEYAIHLELNFVCSYTCTYDGALWNKQLVLLREINQFLSSQRSLARTDLKLQEEAEEFSFVNDMSTLLNKIKMSQLPNVTSTESTTLKCRYKSLDITEKKYNDWLLSKLYQVELLSSIGTETVITDDGVEWLQLEPKEQSLYVYKHPCNVYLQYSNPRLSTTRNIREVEKSAKNLSSVHWSSLEEFISSVKAQISDSSTSQLKLVGKNYEYSMPEYSEEERGFFKEVLLHSLYESSIIRLLENNGTTYIQLTSLGKSVFR